MHDYRYHYRYRYRDRYRDRDRDRDRDRYRYRYHRHYHYFIIILTGVHLESSSINHPELCEKEATQPLVYVTAFDNSRFL